MAIETINPTTGERLHAYPALTDREIDEKLEIAHRAAKSWRATPIEERVSVVRRAGELLERRKAEYGQLMTLDIKAYIVLSKVRRMIVTQRDRGAPGQMFINELR